MRKATVCASFLIFLLLICVNPCRAQQKFPVTGEFHQLSFPEFAARIESSIPVHFYYDTAQLDSFRVSITVSKKPLEELLKEIFDNTDIHFAIDKENHVFITRRYEISASLPPGFFDKASPVADTTVKTRVVAVAADEREKSRFKSALENKLIELGSNASGSGANATIAGYIRDMKTGEPVIGAAIYLENPPIGVVSDQFGYYSFTIPKGRYTLRISSVGMKETRRQVLLNGNSKLDIEMQDFVPSLKAVTVISQKLSNVKGLQMGLERLDIKTIKQVPVVFGEGDVLRVVLTLPGVTSVGEATTGFNVRGGSADQNLVLFNGSTVYNPSHLFGFFTAFNADVIKDVELYKSTIPEKYGGRLSSVLDVTTRDGNKKKLSGTAGIGPLTSKFTLEGPLVKDKTSFILGARGTYSDWLLQTIPDKEYKNSRASFYDLDLHINHEINAKNTLYFSGYYSQDRFKLNSDTVYKYSNRNVNVRWKHIFNNKFYGVVLAGYDYYLYDVSSTNNKINAFDLGFNVSQSNFKADFTLSPNYRHSINFGISSTYYKLHPGSFLPAGNESLVVPNTVPAEQGLESAVYLGDKFEISPKLSLSGGVRFSVFNYLGAHDVYNYVPGLPREDFNIIDTSSYEKNKVIKTYMAPEFRFSLRYILGDNTSLKASYNTLQQYIHLLTNSTAISPTDIWKLSDPNIKPQSGEQYSFGFYQNFKSNTIETSVEVYYRRIHHYLDYKSGAQLLLNHHIETDVINTTGKAYGLEFMVKKLTGKLNGWISYTYSRTFLRMDDPIGGALVNNGDYYPANYDKPHNLNVIGNYKVNHRFSLSVNVSYSTGRPITLPIAIYYLAGTQRAFYSERNQYRIPDYFRTDFSMNIEGNHVVRKKTHNSWTIGIYNVTARKNPYSVYFVQENGVIKGYQLSIFGTAIPFITFNLKF